MSDVIDVFGPAYYDKRAGVHQAGSIRPASRDLSGDARSGNANQIVQRLKQASNSKQSFPTGYPIKSPAPHPISGRLGC